MRYEYSKTRGRVKIARPKVDSRLQNIEKMEEKIESDISEIKEIVTEMKNGNNSNDSNRNDSNRNDSNNNASNNNNEEKIDCLCDETKKELEVDAE